MKELKINILKNNYTGYVPSDYKITKWAKMSCLNKKKSFVTIKLAKESEVINLNKKYFNKRKACNVLSFPLKSEVIKGEYFLGDIVIRPQIVNKESKNFRMKKDKRWAHLVVHSMLHLQGYTHQSKTNREKMEKKEIELLYKLGYTNPYDAN